MYTFVISVECIIAYQEKILIIERPVGKEGSGLLSFPGGGVEGQVEADHRDVLRSAVKREVHEEVGIVLHDPIIYLTSSYFVDSKGNQIIHSVFYTNLIKTNPTVTPRIEEVPAYYWMTKEEINQASKTPEWIKEYLTLI